MRIVPWNPQVSLEGYKVTQCVVDLAFTLELQMEKRRAALRIEGPFEFSRHGKTFHLDPEKDPAGLGPALQLSRGGVVKSVIGDNGLLELTFEDGGIVRVASDPEYEAWTLTFGGGPLVVSGPGGSLSLFRRSRPASRGGSEPPA
jgi:hypothetical protein